MPFSFKYRAYAEALFDALTQDAFYITLQASIADKAQAKLGMLKYLEYSMLEAESRGLLHIPKAEQYGASIWSLPLDRNQAAQQQQEKYAFIQEHLGDASLVTYQAIANFMAGSSENLIPENAWYLSILGVLPEFQNKGLGISLVAEVLAQSDAHGVPTYLETFTARNMSFYERLGYETLASFDEPTTCARYWLMMRKAPSLD